MKLREIKLKQLTKANIRGFLQGYYRKVKFWFSPPELTPLQEQILYRFSEMPDNCLFNKQCPCKCVVPEKQYEDRACEDNCYPDLLDPETWELFKKEKNIYMERVKRVARERTTLYNIKLDFTW